MGPFGHGRPRQAAWRVRVDWARGSGLNFPMCFLKNVGRARLHPSFHDHTSARQSFSFSVFLRPQNVFTILESFALRVPRHGKIRQPLWEAL